MKYLKSFESNNTFSESEDFGDRVSIPDREFAYILEMIRKIFSDGGLDPKKIHISAGQVSGSILSNLQGPVLTARAHKSKSSSGNYYGPFSTNHDYLEIKYGPQYGPADSDIIISKYEDEWFQVYFRKSHGLKYNIKTYKCDQIDGLIDCLKSLSLIII